MIPPTNLSQKLEREEPLLWHQERSILETTELICQIMERDGVTRTELARRLGKTKGYITQLLDGATNMTIRTMSDVFTVLGYEFHPQFSRSMSLGESWILKYDAPASWDQPWHEAQIPSEPLVGNA